MLKRRGPPGNDGSTGPPGPIGPQGPAGTFDTSSCQQVSSTNPITSLPPGFITGGTVNCPDNRFAVSGSCNFAASNFGASHIPVIAASFNTNGGISWQCNYYNPSSDALNMNVIVGAFCC